MSDFLILQGESLPYTLACNEGHVGLWYFDFDRQMNIIQHGSNPEARREFPAPIDLQQLATFFAEVHHYEL